MGSTKIDNLMLGALSEWDDVRDFCQRHASLNPTERIEFRTTVGIANSVLQDVEAAVNGTSLSGDQRAKLEELRRMASELNPVAENLLTKAATAA